jgi:endogenous inhibitor of DNA gyrase (YacG/DUF329 family)
MRKYLIRVESQNLCKVCGKEFEGFSKYYCSKKCAKVDDLPKKLEKAWYNIKGYTKKLSRTL